MGIIEIILVGIGLAMDAFAVAVCKGLSMQKLDIKKIIIIPTYFGFFQSIMLLIGYFLAISFESKISYIDHWIVFFLLGFIGCEMIWESFKEKNENIDDKIDIKTMVILSLATSIDALAVGITLAFLDTNIGISAIVIGIITFVLSLIGVKIGNIFGEKYKVKAKRVGGTILIILGIKILLEHLSLL